MKRFQNKKNLILLGKVTLWFKTKKDYKFSEVLICRTNLDVPRNLNFIKNNFLVN